MADHLIIAGSWLILAGFFLFFNMRITTSSINKFITFWGIWICVVVAIWNLVDLTRRVS